MRLRLLRRRLTLSAPRVVVRSALPWPLRWALVAVVLGFCAAIGLWAFEFGKEFAGVPGASREEIERLRAEVQQLQAEREKLQSVFNTSSSLLTAERAARERLEAQMRQVEAENHALRDDLGFFERLLPAAPGGNLAIRALSAEALPGGKLRWQVLVLQPQRNAPEFSGTLALAVSGTQGDRPWTQNLPPLPLKMQQYRRLEGVLDVPAGVVVKGVSAQVLEGATVRSVQSIKL